MNILSKASKVIPTLCGDLYKGNCGKIAVIGGSTEYTGAPYYAGQSSLRSGADLCHIFCSQHAATPIKCYSPDIIVHPVFPDFCNDLPTPSLADSAADAKVCAEKITRWLPSMTAVVLGPGLGRNAFTLECVKLVISEVQRLNIPLVVDADGLYLLSQAPDLIQGYPKTILTPNRAEFDRLVKATFLHTLPDWSAKSQLEQVQFLAKHLGVLVVKKGPLDIVWGPQHTISSAPLTGSSRRCGGQGDILAGAIATFASWADGIVFDSTDGPFQSLEEAYVSAIYCALILTKTCNLKAYHRLGRTFTASDMLTLQSECFQELFE